MSVAAYFFSGENPRLLALKGWAESKGWTFSAEKQKGFNRRFPQFRCLVQGSDRYADNIVQGRWGSRSLMSFDYHYTTKEGKRRIHNVFSAIVLAPDIPLIPLVVRREKFSDRLASVFGYGDINFESADFSRRYHVSSPDRKWAYDVLHVRAIEDLLLGSGHPFQFSDTQAIVWADGTLEADELEEALQMLTKIIDGIPDFAREAAVAYAAGHPKEVVGIEEDSPDGKGALGHKLASGLAVAYVLACFGALWLTGIGSEQINQVIRDKWSILGPFFICAGLAKGLWQRRRWAWVLGIAAAALQSLYLGWLIFVSLTYWHRPPAAFLALNAGLMACFMVILLWPGTRAACNR